ncbi:hypothetical protein BDV96DRAFT_99198 [Lophiotrema nucula]|uniref:Uncharacterized protein n=1 Tax=Lophiotrema nucula TaxID=690887 RepID=A0A6A5Z6S5_9PLEO|nr:hypothetical protein BDV96DRAFT_99198 [Lophiotrema nucula]
MVAAFRWRSGRDSLWLVIKVTFEEQLYWTGQLRWLLCLFGVSFASFGRYGAYAEHQLVLLFVLICCRASAAVAVFQSIFLFIPPMSVQLAVTIFDTNCNCGVSEFLTRDAASLIARQAHDTFGLGQLFQIPHRWTLIQSH